jgi:hypothetical protein
MATDQQFREEMLQCLYERRHDGDGWVSLPKGLPLPGWGENVKINILRQLKASGLAEWQRTAKGPFAGRARITAQGIHEIEAPVVVPPEEIALKPVPAAHPTHTLIAWLAFIAGIFFGIMGVVLVWLGATGSSTIEFLGVKVSTTSVGVAAIALAVLLIYFTFQRVLESVDKH